MAKAKRSGIVVLGLAVGAVLAGAVVWSNWHNGQTVRPAEQSATQSTPAPSVFPISSAATATHTPDGHSIFKDASLLKPANGAKVSIIEFEDLECPFCAQMYPIVHEAAEKYHVPIERHDFLIPGHVWSPQAAVTARYLEDYVSPQSAGDFRRDVFASQNGISSREDLGAFTHNWFQQHGLTQPFVIDPRCEREVQADCELGNRLGVGHTPTIVVVSQNMWVEVLRPSELYAAIDRVQSAVRTAS